MRIAIPITPDEDVDSRWGKAHDVVVADIEDAAISSWEVHEVAWDRLHDEGSHGAHHARIVRFLKANDVAMVVIAHAGAPMLNTMKKMGLTVVTGASGPARQAAFDAARADRARGVSHP